MNRSEFLTAVTSKLDSGLSVQVASLPGWGSSRFFKDLEIAGRKLIKLDGNLMPFVEPTTAMIDDKLPTTFVIDHFDELLQKADKSLFNHLRSLRDIRKYHVTFVVLTSQRDNFRLDTEQLGSFHELVSESKFYFPACDQQETDEVVSNVLEKYSLKVSNDERDKIWQFSGGIPALIKSWLIRRDTDDVSQTARAQGSLQRVWRALPEIHQRQLIDLSNGETLEITKALTEWRIVENGQIISQALAKFVHDQTTTIPSSTTPIIAKFEHQLTKIEHLLFSCLNNNIGRVCDRDKLIAAAWPDDNAEGVSEEALDQAMSRLRKKMTDSGYQIITMKGRGFMLKMGSLITGKSHLSPYSSPD